MQSEKFPSVLLERAVSEFAQLPGIGRKTALRLVLHLLRQEDERVFALTESLNRMKQDICYCSECNSIADEELCPICANHNRTGEILCVVENIRDVLSIENTQQYKGKYHVLGGIISPMEGVGPSDIAIDMLVERVAKGNVTEVILALSTTMEGDTTNFYIFKKLKPYEVRITTLARGVALGDELEYADELTLGRSIKHRTLYEETLTT